MDFEEEWIISLLMKIGDLIGKTTLLNYTKSFYGISEYLLENYTYSEKASNLLHSYKQCSL